MNREQNIQKQINAREKRVFAYCVSIGLLLGTLMGYLFGNPAIGAAFGVVIGAMVGSVFYGYRTSRIKNQTIESDLSRAEG